MIKHTTRIATILFVLIFSSNVFSEEKKSSDKIPVSDMGFSTKWVTTSNSSTGMLFGWRYVAYPSHPFFIGGEVYTGQISQDTSTGSMTYGGVRFGRNVRWGSDYHLQYGLLAGGGGASTGTTISLGGILIEPSITFATTLGKNVRTGLVLGYGYFPNNPDMSFASVAFRFDFLNFSKD